MARGFTHALTVMPQVILIDKLDRSARRSMCAGGQKLRAEGGNEMSLQLDVQGHWCKFKGSSDVIVVLLLGPPRAVDIEGAMN